MGSVGGLIRKVGGYIMTVGGIIRTVGGFIRAFGGFISTVGDLYIDHWWFHQELVVLLGQLVTSLRQLVALVQYVLTYLGNCVAL